MKVLEQAQESLPAQSNEQWQRGNIVDRLASKLGGIARVGAVVMFKPSHHMAEYYRWSGLSQLTMEGFSSPGQAEWFKKLVDNKPHIKNVAEVGFNGGHMSFNLLKSRTDIRVTSFDLCDKEYMAKAKEEIDRRFPGRHELIVGDSSLTVPEYVAENPEAKFDLIFVDGSHEYDGVREDLLNLRSLAHPGTMLIADDYTPDKPWGRGPVLAWNEQVEAGRIENQGVISFAGRNWAMGRYIQDFPEIS